MRKKLKIETSNGNRYYEISEYSGEFYCYKKHDGGNNIGKAKNLEDAVIICKVDATLYGSVRKVVFES